MITHIDPKTVHDVGRPRTVDVEPLDRDVVQPVISRLPSGGDARWHVADLMPGIRRPPPMSLATAPPPGPEAVVADDFTTLSKAETANIALRTAVLAARLQDPIAHSGDIGAERGYRTLTLQARMYEHLHLLCTTGGDRT